MPELDDLHQQIRFCKDCELYREANNPVPGEGSSEADLMLIGEGPGYQEDKQGRPFVGPAGKFLNELLALIGLRREDVFIVIVGLRGKNTTGRLFTVQQTKTPST